MTTANRFSALFNAPTKISQPDPCSYTNFFPSLDEAKRIPTKSERDLVVDSEFDKDATPRSFDHPDFDNDSTSRSSAKKVPIKFILGPRSYEDELRSQDALRQDEIAQKRMDAFEILANKEKLEAGLVKTRMCNSVDKKETCPHAENCRFAHSLDELKISVCLFGDRCRFVRVWNGKLYNNGAKVCNHKHPQEDDDEFITRVGLDRYKSKSEDKIGTPPIRQRPTELPPQVVVPPPPVWQRPTELPQVVVPPQPTQPIELPQVVAPTQPTELPQVVAPPTDPILIIRVPKELASQALEIAMKSGRTHIQVEII